MFITADVLGEKTAADRSRADADAGLKYACIHGGAHKAENLRRMGTPSAL